MTANTARNTAGNTAGDTAEPQRHRWLVGHDFSAGAEAAARAAAHDLATSRDGGTLILCYVYDVLPPPMPLDGAIAGANLVELERTVAQDSARRLEVFAELLREELGAQGGSTVEVEVVVRPGPAADALVEEARARGAERIAMGTHGRTGLRHLLLGSVAERVVRHASVPVLVVKAEPAVHP